jgi:hypothetical protein
MNIIGAASPNPRPRRRSGHGRSAALPLCAAAITIVGGVVALPAASADGGCIPGNIPGEVPRLTRASDNVCVTPHIADEVKQENAAADAGQGYAGGGAYGPKTCVSGLVWREGYDGDGVCVSPQRRTETWQENANAGVGATGGLKPQTNPAGGTTPPVGGTTPPAGGTTPAAGTPGSPDSALLAAVNDARLHPEKYPPLPDTPGGKVDPGATMTACPSGFNDAAGLDQAASTHIGFISNVSDAVMKGGDGKNAHRNPPPSGPLSWEAGAPIAQAGYNSARGEIVAWGYSDAASAVVSWMQKDGSQSWGHRNNILNCSYRDAGASHLAGGVEGNYWVVDMGTK